MNVNPAITLLLLAGLIAGCDDPSTGPSDAEPARLVLVEDLDASGTAGQFTFFDLDDSTAVADSTSPAWDLAFRSTLLLVNSGESGPGAARATLYPASFDELAALPGDAELKAGGGPDAPAVPAVSSEGWYHYSGNPSHLITPVPGHTILVETSEGRFAKIRILSYYRGNPDEPGSTDARFYTFEYVLSDVGSTSFE
jgi:hypothetical protein